MVNILQFCKRIANMIAAILFDMPILSIRKSID